MGASIGAVVALVAEVAWVIGTPVAHALPSVGDGACQLMPIGTNDATIAATEAGDEVADILNGGMPGNRGWLTWSGDVSKPVLAASLALPGDSGSYVDPDEAADKTVSVGDWVRARPGVVSACRDRLRDSARAPRSLVRTGPRDGRCEIPGLGA